MPWNGGEGEKETQGGCLLVPQHWAPKPYTSGPTAPLTLSRRLLQKAMSGSLSLPENTSLWGSSLLRVSPRIMYAWDM